MIALVQWIIRVIVTAVIVVNLFLALLCTAGVLSSWIHTRRYRARRRQDDRHEIEQLIASLPRPQSLKGGRRP